MYPFNFHKKTILILAILLLPFSGFAQVTLEQALTAAAGFSPSLEAAELNKQKQGLLLPSTYTPQGPELLFEAPTGNGLRPGVLQSFQFPGVYAGQYRYQKSQLNQAGLAAGIAANELRFAVRSLYNEVQYLQEALRNHEAQDSLYTDLLETTQLRVQVGQLSPLELLNAESKARAARHQVMQTRQAMQAAQTRLALKMGLGEAAVAAEPFRRFVIGLPQTTDTLLQSNPLVAYLEGQESASEQLLRLEKVRLLPGLTLGYLNQGEDGSTPVLQQMRFGLSLPVWAWMNSSRIRAYEVDTEITRQQTLAGTLELSHDLQSTLATLQQQDDALLYYTQTALPTAEKLAASGAEAFRLGSIGYYSYLANLQQVFETRAGYLESLRTYNQAAIRLLFLQGQ
jgi:cobalt-zinc-cadmium resistance protein CzcA